MRLPCIRWCSGFALLLLSANVGHAADEYLIPDFLHERVYDQPANDYWDPAPGAGGAVRPDSARLEDFILRRKSGKTEYSLFPGAMKDGVYRKLFAFRLDGPLFKDRFRTKFYAGREAVWFRDMEDVYFQEDLVFSAQPLLFWNRGGEWVELRSLPRKSVRLVLRSDPPGAAVFLDGKSVGNAPVVRIGIADPFVLLRMDMPGRYSREEPVGIASDSEVVVEWRLHALLPEDAVPAGDSLPLQGWSKPTSPDLRGYEERYRRVAGRVESLTAALEAKRTAFDSLYPRFIPKEEFEKKAGFASRDSAYRAERARQWTRSSRALDSSLRAHQKVLGKIASYERPLQYQLKLRALADPDLQLSRYDADSEKYPFDLREEGAALRFAYRGGFHLDPDRARSLKLRPDSLACSAQYWNIEARGQDGQVRYPALDSLVCAYGGKPIALEAGGVFSVDSADFEPASLRRALALAVSFDSSRQEEARLRRDAEERKARQAIKDRNRRIRLFSGIATLALAAGVEFLAYSEKGKADKAYGDYRAADSRQSAAAARSAVDNHDRNFLWLGISGGGLVAGGVVLSLF